MRPSVTFAERVRDRVSGMSRARRRRGASLAPVAAWALFGAATATMLLGRWLEFRVRSITSALLFEEIMTGAAFLGFPAMGALIASRRPRNPIGWILVAIGVGAAVMVAAMAFTRHELVLHDNRTPVVVFAAWLESWVWYPLLITIPTFLLFLFPTGRPASPRWRWLLWVAGAFMAVISITAILQARLRGDGYDIDNPIGVATIRDVEEMLAPLFIGILGVVAAALASLVVRYRAGTREERQQIKWVAWAAAIFITTSAAGDLLEGRVEVPTILFPVTLAGIPVSMAVAVLKYRLYELERIINRTLVYVALTAVLAIIYFGLVVALQGMLSPVTSESDLAVAASTLGVAALFGPLRRRIQGFIDRRFYRSRYNAQRTLEHFSSRLRDEVDLEHLSHELVTVVAETMRPRHASLWLRAPDGSRT